MLQHLPLPSAPCKHGWRIAAMLVFVAVCLCVPLMTARSIRAEGTRAVRTLRSDLPAPGVWRSPGVVTELTQADVQGTDVIVVMMDSRWDASGYWTKTMRINAHYCNRYGYRLLAFYMSNDDCIAADQTVQSCKTLAMHELLRVYAEINSNKPLTVIYVDSDAYFRDQELTPNAFLEEAGSISPTDEQPLVIMPACKCQRPWSFRRDIWPTEWFESRAYLINSGIVVFRIFPQTLPRMQEIVLEWAARSAADKRFPNDQTALKDMLLNDNGAGNFLAIAPGPQVVWCV